MDIELKKAIERDNQREDAGMPGDDRETCWTHQGWDKDCEGDPVHTNPSVSHFYRRA